MSVADGCVAAIISEQESVEDQSVIGDGIIE
jgi:hypothetical protein